MSKKKRKGHDTYWSITIKTKCIMAEINKIKRNHVSLKNDYRIFKIYAQWVRSYFINHRNSISFYFL